jgi:hypothetical protein
MSTRIEGRGGGYGDGFGRGSRLLLFLKLRGKHNITGREFVAVVG